MIDPTSLAAAPQEQGGRFTRPDARRSLILAALGALAGLLIAGFGLFTAQGTRTSALPPEAAALVNGVPILRIDMIGQLRALDDVSLTEATGTQKRAVLEDMIREELLVQRGLELGMPTDDIETRNALVGAVHGQLASDVLAAIPSATALRSYYDAHRARYASEGTMTLEALRAPSQEAARATISALRSGASIARLQSAYGVTSFGKVDDGEEYYFAARIHLGPQLFAVARGLNDGQVSEPIATPDGPVILSMQSNKRPVAESFEAARSRLLDDYTRDRIADLDAANGRFLQARAEITIAPDLR